ncbi:GTPase [Planctomyces sp. SH-PL62]|uniref:GTPase n=1 Tax=Planctomyces sp. SH-PL62 TaxID=1636152 RepID=UPI00078B45A6|nr:GTPase [Planctomyces sp. SH-PL62]AMV39892.1 tRNA modification GTPase TrmE [Planctomyces sp. SH-PL62]
MPSPRNRPRLFAPIAAALVAGGLFLAVAASGERLGNWRPGLLIGLGLAVCLTLGVLGLALVRSRREARDDREEASPLDPVALAEAAQQQSARAREYIARIRDDRRREELQGELVRLDEGRLAASGELDIVVFGTVSAGKTSLINALIGREVGETGAVMGTTRQGENHIYTLQGAEGVLRLVDTPGIAEAGPGAAGASRRPGSWPNGPTCSSSSSITT